jgi:cyclophilin family peptidyl-prolyl cis-trans isomerase/protein-disulfide isomerase
MRALFAVLLAAGLVLAGCAQPAPVIPSPTATLPPTLTPVPPTPTPAGPSPTPAPTATQPSLFAPVTGADWQIGPKDAVVTLVVYDDFQCSFCAGLERILTQLRQEFSGDIRLVFRHYPLPQDDKARLAASAAEAAGLQSKFWEMHDQLFSKQTAWAALSVADFGALLDQYAQGLGLDVSRFDVDRNSSAVAAKIEKAYQTAVAVPLPGAPFVLFNGEPFHDQGLTDHWALSTLIRLEKLKMRQFHQPPPDVINPFKSYVATIQTAKGNIVVQLFADKAPLTVNNFVFLCQQGWYDGVTFHRVITDFAAETGDPSGTGYGGPGYFIPDEIVPELKYDGPGWVGMANAGPNTNGSQFFISLAALPQFDGKYPLFGKVVSGMDVVQKLAPRDPNLDAEAPPGDSIQTIKIEEK